MTDKEIKELIEPKKEQIKQSFKDRATYNKWDKHSPIWVYNILTNESKEITEPKQIKYILRTPQPFTHFFLTKESMETYKWIHELIEMEIDNRVSEGFNSGSAFDNFVDFKDIENKENRFYLEGELTMDINGSTYKCKHEECPYKDCNYHYRSTGKYSHTFPDEIPVYLPFCEKNAEFCMSYMDL